MLLEGVFAAIPTPYQPDGRPHWHHMERNVERYSRAPLAGLVVLGSTGEAVMLNDEETREALRVARDAAADDRILIAGVGHESLIETLKRIEHAASLDYDLALVRTPHFYRPQLLRSPTPPAEILNYYRMVADASALPVLLYSIPAYTAYELPVDAISELSGHKNIYGIKDSGGKPERIAAIVAATASAPRRNVAVTATFAAVTGRMLNRQAEAAGLAAALMPADALMAGGGYAAPPLPSFKTRIREVGFQVLCGSAQTLLPSLTAGATGGVLAMASFAPQACAEIYMAWKDRDGTLAQEKQERIRSAADLICGRLGIPGVKHACDLNGYYGGLPRLPLLPLTAAERDEVEQSLHNIRQ